MKKKHLSWLSFILLVHSSLGWSKSIVNERSLKHIKLRTGFYMKGATIKTKSSSLSKKGSQSANLFGIAVRGSFPFNEKFAAEASFIVVDGDLSGKGFELAGKWYVFNNGLGYTARINGLTIVTKPTWSPYAVLGYTSKNYQFSSGNITFAGLKVGGGTEWFPLSQDFFVDFSLEYEFAANGNLRTLSGFGVAASIGALF